MIRSKTERLDVLTTVLKDVERELSLPLLLCLLAVARSPGISVNELALEIAVPQQTASRYIATLQGRYQNPTGQFDHIVERPLVSLEISSDDPRKRALYLTKRGDNWVERFLSKLFGAEEI